MNKTIEISEYADGLLKEVPEYSDGLIKTTDLIMNDKNKPVVQIKNNPKKKLLIENEYLKEA